MIRTLEDIMYISDGNNPYREDLLYGRGGLGYKPTPYNIIGNGMNDSSDDDKDFVKDKMILSNILKMTKLNKGQRLAKERIMNKYKNNPHFFKMVDMVMKGGMIIDKDKEGKIKEIREYNDNDIDNINRLNDLDEDNKLLSEHLEYLTIPEDIKDFLKENNIDEKEFITQTLDDMSKIYNLTDIGIKLSTELSAKIDDVIKDEELSNDEKIKEFNNEIDLFEKERNNIILLRSKKPKLESIYTPMIHELNRGIERIKQEVINIQNIDNPKQKIKPIKPTYTNYTEEISDRKLPKRYKYIPSKETVKQVEKLNQQMNDTNKKYKKFGISDKEYINAIIPSGGAKEFENVIEGNKTIQKELYKKAGLKKASENPELENLQNKFGDNPNLPIDTVDWLNNVFNELKKYKKYDYNSLKNDLENKEVNYFQNRLLNELNLRLDKDNKKSNKEIEHINNLFNQLSNEKGELDKNKIIDYIEKNIGGISIPIGTTKFGNIGKFEGNELNNISTKEYVIQEGLNDNWKIEFDYNQFLKNGKLNPDYGKIVSLKEITKDKGKVKYGDETIDKPFDYIFTIATKNELLVFNYSKFIKEKGIKSPMDIFKVGNDFYDSSSDKVSYFIPLKYFEKVPKTSFINPLFTDEEIIDSIENYFEKNDLAEELEKYKKYFDKYKDDYNEILESSKINENNIKKFIGKFFKNVEITNQLRLKTDLIKVLNNNYPITKVSKEEKQENKNKREKYLNMYDNLILKNNDNFSKINKIIDNIKKDIKKKNI